MWINGSYSTEFSGSITMNGFPIYGWNSKSFTRAGTSTPLLSIASGEAARSAVKTDSIIDIYDSLQLAGLPPKPFKVFLDSAKKYKIPVTTISSAPTATDLNSKYTSLSASQKLGGANGFMVISGKGTDWDAVMPGGTFQYKLIWIVESSSLDYFRASHGFFESGDTSVIFLYLKRTVLTQMQGYTKFRGYIYVDSIGSTTQCIFSNSTGDATIEGGVHIQDGIFRREGSYTLYLKYSTNVMSSLSSVGMFVDPTPVVVPVDSLVLVSPNISTKMMALSF